MIHFDSFLSYSKENISIDDVCTFYVEYMWQLIGGNEVMSESWTGSNIMSIEAGALKLSEEHQNGYFRFFPLCHYH